MFTDNIWDETAWSDPIYFDNPGFDQDVSVMEQYQYLLELMFPALLG